MQDVNRYRMFPETLVAFADEAIFVTDVHGRVARGLEGFYRHQTRFLSRLGITIDGREPTFVSANAVDPYSFISYYLAPGPGDGETAASGIELQVNRFVGGGLHQDVILTNHTLAPATVELAFEVDADFADIAEAIQGHRQQQAPVARAWQAGVLAFTYQHPELHHGVELRFGGEPTYDGKVIYSLLLAPREPVKLCLDVVPIHCGQAVEPAYGCGAFRSHGTAMDVAREAWEADSARLITPNMVVQQAWDRATADLVALARLEGDGAEIYTPAAGIPLYQALFGRDTLTAAWQASLATPLMLRGTIDTLGRQLGTKVDDRFDEQPGRVLHQRQLSPLSLLELNPYLHYYGDYAGPGMFLVAIGWHYAQTGDRAFFRRLRPQIDAVLAWMDRDGDRDGDGFYEYDTRAGAWGTKNQGWKDSNQAILRADGAMVENPIAAVEIQGYYYAAKQLLGLVYLATGEAGHGLDLLEQARALKRRFNLAYWMPEERFYALALDADKRQVTSIASNVGHCLACGIIDHDKAAAVGARLMQPDMFSGWGIRTLSADHPAYNPFTYHLGAVWPSENGSIALGFKRYGLIAELHALAKGLFDATRLFDLNRFPEAIGGHARDALHPHPGIYPHSCAPQAWSASAVVVLIQALAGIVPLAKLGTLVIDPELPDWLPELTLENVQVGDARVSLAFKRDAGGHTDYQVLARQGSVRVVRQPPPDDLGAGIGGRLMALLGSLRPH
ncbi:MAG: Amylo-alpha,6-glucosidase [Cyanobacteria bacterium RYN_339]|nr:Amylo-alpha,6-glucosidase [Cyanobacteria bacterium RYN_339]